MRAGRTPLALAVQSLVLCPLACAVYNDESLGQPPIGGFGAESTGGGAGSSAKAGSSNGSSSAGSNAKPQGGNASLGGNAGSAASSGGNDDVPAGGEAAGGSSSGGKGGSAATGGAGGGGGGGKGGTGGGGKGGTGGGGGTTGGGGGGTSGAAGGATAPACSDHPLSARSAWTAMASHTDSANSGVPSNLLDGKTTRWSTGKAQSGDEWLQIDFGATATINHVNLQQGDDTNDYPRGYSVIVSNTPKDLSGTVRVTGSGKSGVSTAILLPALVSGRYLLIKQSSASLSWWSAEEIEVSCAD